MPERRSWTRRFACFVLFASSAWLGAAHDATARALVEPGDVLVSVGDTVFAVRADGSSVAPFSPRPGSGANLFGVPTGIAVDPVRGRVLVGNALGELFVVDPDDGAQTRVTGTFGGALDVGDIVSALAIREDGSLLAASSSLASTFPFPVYESHLYLVSPPSAAGEAITTSFADLPIGFALSLHGVAVAEPTIGDPQILVSTFAIGGGTLGTVDVATRDFTLLGGIPVQSGAYVADAALDCSSGLASLCARFWVEGSASGSSCNAADAAIFRSSFSVGTVPLYVGPPLRCPFGRGGARRDCARSDAAARTPWLMPETQSEGPSPVSSSRGVDPFDELTERHHDLSACRRRPARMRARLVQSRWIARRAAEFCRAQARLGRPDRGARSELTERTRHRMLAPCRASKCSVGVSARRHLRSPTIRRDQRSR